MEYLSATMTVDRTPAEVFAAILDVRGWWNENLIGNSAALHDEFVFTDDFAYANLAVRGQRAHEVLATQVEAALAMEPDVVTLTAGMNDLLRPRFDPDVLRATLAEIVAPFTAKGARLVVVPIPDIRSSGLRSVGPGTDWAS